MQMARKQSNIVDFKGRPTETREQILERLFKEHGAALRAFLHVRMDSHADMDDIAQEVFIRLAKLEGLEFRLEPSNESNRSFIITVANNLVLDLEKSQKVRYRYAEQTQAQVIDDDLLATPSPELITESRQQLERLREVILNLNPNWRKAFILNRFKAKSYREISVEMGVSVKQVEKYMKGALIQIRKVAKEFKDTGEKS